MRTDASPLRDPTRTIRLHLSHLSVIAVDLHLGERHRPEGGKPGTYVSKAEMRAILAESDRRQAATKERAREANRERSRAAYLAQKLRPPPPPARLLEMAVEAFRRDRADAFCARSPVESWKYAFEACAPGREIPPMPDVTIERPSRADVLAGMAQLRSGYCGDAESHHEREVRVAKEKRAAARGSCGRVMGRRDGEVAA